MADIAAAEAGSMWSVGGASSEQGEKRLRTGRFQPGCSGLSTLWPSFQWQTRQPSRVSHKKGPVRRSARAGLFLPPRRRFFLALSLSGTKGGWRGPRMRAISNEEKGQGTVEA